MPKNRLDQYDDGGESVDDIISQLRDTKNEIVAVNQEPSLTKEKMEEFIIKKAGELVSKSLNLVDRVQEYISSAPESKDVEAVSGLISATSSAIDTLNKVYVIDEKNKTQIKVKQMDVDSREKINTIDNQTKILLSREEVLKALIEGNDDVIDV
jgi:DNA-binding FrmR family transcriptional regulator